MNVLIATFSFPSIEFNNHDGAFVFSEAMAYAENGANVNVVTPHYRGVKKKEMIGEKITVYRFQYFLPKSRQVLKKAGVPIYNQRSFLAMAQIPMLCLFFVINILKHSVSADIIHAQWTVTALLSLPAKWLLGKKIVLTARGSDLRLLPKWLNRFIHSRVDGALDCFGPQPWNDQYKKTFRAHYIPLPQIVRNDSRGSMPEDMKEALKGKSEPFIILYIGRFDSIKIDINKLPLINLIHVAKILTEKEMNFHLFFIGDGDEHIRNRMLRLIRELELQAYVTMLGVKTNVSDYIHYCHIGFGGIAFNAVSQEFSIQGKPQILIDGRDNANMLWCHDKNTVFVRPDDNVDLLERLIWAMENPNRIRNIGEEAKHDMKAYIVDVREGGKLYLQEFRKLLN